MLMKPADDIANVELGFYTSDGLVLSAATRIPDVKQ